MGRKGRRGGKGRESGREGREGTIYLPSASRTHTHFRLVSVRFSSVAQSCPSPTLSCLGHSYFVWFPLILTNIYLQKKVLLKAKSSPFILLITAFQVFLFVSG